MRGDVLKFSTVGAHHGIGDILNQRPALRFGVLPFRHRRHDAIPREGRPLTCDEHRRRTVQKNDRDALRHLVVGAVPFVRDQDIGELLHQPRFGLRLQRSFGNGDVDHRHDGVSPWLRLYCFDWAPRRHLYARGSMDVGRRPSVAVSPSFEAIRTGGAAPWAAGRAYRARFRTPSILLGSALLVVTSAICFLGRYRLRSTARASARTLTNWCSGAFRVRSTKLPSRYVGYHHFVAGTGSFQ